MVNSIRHGVRLGFDIGSVRIGVATCDSGGLLATPLTTIQRHNDDFLGEILALLHELSPVEIIVGLPLALSGSVTASTRDALTVARAIAEATGVDVRMVDERLTTVSAHGALRQNGKKQKETRQIIDQVAAVMILQHALDSERATGRLPGKLIADIQDD